MDELAAGWHVSLVKGESRHCTLSASSTEPSQALTGVLSTGVQTIGFQDSPCIPSSLHLCLRQASVLYMFLWAAGSDRMINDSSFTQLTFTVAL